MLIIHDARIPQEAIDKLRTFGTCLPFLTKGITYEPIAGHPDIFICPVEKDLVIAPNLPSTYKEYLQTSGHSILEGKTAVGKEKENSTQYNVVVTDKYVVHNRHYTDPIILSLLNEKHFIEVKQVYTRCSLLPLKDNHFLTSDKGIEKALQSQGIEVDYMAPEHVLLPGANYGLIGGCMGIHQNKIFLIGKLSYHPENEVIKKLASQLQYELIELYDGPFFDGGSLIFLD